MGSGKFNVYSFRAQTWIKHAKYIYLIHQYVLFIIPSKILHTIVSINYITAHLTYLSCHRVSSSPPTVSVQMIWLTLKPIRCLHQSEDGTFGWLEFPWVGLSKQSFYKELISDPIAEVTLLLCFPGKAKFIAELLVPVAPFDQKSGREARTVAFAPNGSYLAWSQGRRIVRLIPWAKCLKSL